jgi:hypothetical protein
MATKAKSTLEDEFLPKDYKLPDSSPYMKFVAGKNRFRILSSLVEGYEYWKPGEDGKDVPVRSREMPVDTSDGKVNPKTGKVDVNHFWLVAVWNYANESIQELTITQKGIKSYILERINDPAWGNPRGYDIVVNKVGEGLTTKYTTATNPHAELDPEITEAYAKANINLESVFEDEA